MAEVFLVVIVPFGTVGWGRFENSGFYAALFGLKGVDASIEKRFTTQFEKDEGTFLGPDDPKTRQDFEDVWSLATRFSGEKLNRGKPKLIGRSAVSNAPSVSIPGHEKPVLLVPESAPIFALYCSLAELAAKTCLGENRGVVLGTVQELRGWRDRRQQQLRANVEFVVAGISLILGVALWFLPES